MLTAKEKPAHEGLYYYISHVIELNVQTKWPGSNWHFYNGISHFKMISNIYQLLKVYIRIKVGNRNI